MSSCDICLPQEPIPVYNVNLNLVSPEKPANSEHQSESSIKEKITQISSCVLILFGALFLFASAGLFTSSLFLGVVGSPAALLGEAMYPLGVLSLMAGINLFQDGSKKEALKISSRLGPVTVSM